MTKKQRIENMRVLGMCFLFLHEENPKRVVDMRDGCWNICGTVACHAGHFADFIGKASGAKFNYLDSARMMNKFLGFTKGYHLEKWAAINPTIWGNDCGINMFCDWCSFDPGHVLPLNLKTIGTHWLNVADRYERSDII